MSAGRVVAVIFGVLIIIAGVYCVMSPTATYMSLAWLLGLVMCVDGIANAVTWFQARRFGFSSPWALVGAIASIVLGFILIFSFAAQLAVNLFITYLLAAWLIVGGLTRVMMGWSARSMYKQMGEPYVGKNWWVSFVLGIVLVLVGVVSLFDPFGLMATIGVFIGLLIIVMGIGVIGLAA